jgi:MoaA/NifB/PqqE/SkfB family radical SAM enzyme
MSNECASERLEDALKSNSFCLYPFTHLNFKVDGQTAPCFRSKPTGEDRDPEFGWNSDELKNLRKNLLSGERPSTCDNCWKLEDAGVESYRITSLKEMFPFNQWRSALNSYDDLSGKMKIGPKQIELRFTNECNLQCRMCGPLYSSKWERFIKENVETYEQMGRALGRKFNRFQPPTVREIDSQYKQSLLSSIQKWSGSLEYIMIAGGEPLLQEEHLEALHLMMPNAKNIILEYSTNLSILSCKNEDILELWKMFKGIVLKVSIDGDPLTYQHVRRYANIDRLEKNVQRVHEELHDKVSKFIGTITCSVYNVPRIIECVEYVTSLGLSFHTSQVQFPEVLSSQVLPAEEKEKINRRIDDFVENIDVRMEESFLRHKRWHSQWARKDQIERVRLHLNNTKDFMNHYDRQDLFGNFLEYDRLLDAEGRPRIFEIYPDWKLYLKEPIWDWRKTRELKN